MINRIIILVLFGITTSQSITAQLHDPNIYSGLMRPVTKDSLTIERENGQKIRIVWPFRKNIHKHVDWTQLLDDFQQDFKKVSEDVPAYKFYHINYVQKKSLTVDEVTGRETYTVNEQNNMDYVKSNLCRLTGEKLTISIEFTDQVELLDPSLNQDIQNAVSQVKNKFYISAASPERHLFDVKQNKMLPRPKPELKVFVPMGVQLGLLQNKGYVELRSGLGLKVDKYGFIAVNWNLMTQYNSDISRTQFDSYIGLSSGTVGQGFGSEFGFLVKSGIASERNRPLMRAGINYRTRDGLLIGAKYYLSDRGREFDNSIDFGFSIGYGF